MSIDDKDKIKQSLLQLATGYDYNEIEVITTPDGKPTKIKKSQKHVQPQLEAIREVRRLMAVGAWGEESCPR